MNDLKTNKITKAQWVKAALCVESQKNDLKDRVDYLKKNHVDYPQLAEWLQEDLESLNALLDFMQEYGGFDIHPDKRLENLL